mgnify:CR=1 FL=1
MTYKSIIYLILFASSFTCASQVAQGEEPLKAKNVILLIGDGTATSYTITHNYNTRKIAVQCARTTTPFDTVYLDVERTTVNTITLTTTTALPTNGVEVFLQIIK